MLKEQLQVRTHGRFHTIAAVFQAALNKVEPCLPSALVKMLFNPT